MPTIVDFERRGLYDPTAATAADRLRLLEWLTEQGFTLDELVQAQRLGTLTAVAADRALRPGARWTFAEAAARAGVDAELIERLRRAAGLPPIVPDERRFSDADVETFRMFPQAVQLFSEREALHFMRVLGASLARIADAAVSLYLANVERVIVEAGRSELALAQANLQAVQLLVGPGPRFEELMRVHLEEAIRRSREARASFDTATLAIGFVDLVGFTTLSRELGPGELAEVVAEFEARAFDLVAEHEGRVVKLIGDEVMFVAVDPRAACDAALALIDAFPDRRPLVTPRGGLAYGELLARGGDYYGPIVNLASRIAELAVPNELLVTEAIAARASGLVFEAAGRRLLRGFAEPIPLLAAARARVPVGAPVA